MKPLKLGTALLILLSISLLSCDQKQDGQKQVNQKQNVSVQSDLSEVRAAIAEISQKLNQAVLADDYETQLSFLADGITIDPPMEPPVRGIAAVREGMARAQKEGMKYRSFSGTTEDLWTSGDKVYERGTWGMSFTTNRMTQPIAPYGSFFEIWTKDDAGKYRIQYLVYTLDVNPCEKGNI